MPSRPALVTRLLLAALLVLLPACSRKLERLVGNERLARGPGGLGATTRVVAAPDRDTWVDTGTRVGGPVLLVANTGSFEAVAFLQVRAWKFPTAFRDTVGAVKTVVLFAPAFIDSDTVNTPFGVPIQFGKSASTVDTSTVTYPGPAMGQVLGEATWDVTTSHDLFTMDLALTDTSSVDSLIAWKNAPASAPTFQLRVPSAVGGSMGVFKAGGLFLRIAYDSLGLGVKTVDTPIATDLYVHSPLSAVATGGESTLRLGGVEGPAVALHFPVPNLPPGAAINEGTLLLHVNEATSTTAFATGKVTVDLQVRTLGTDWTEAAPDTVSRTAGAIPVATLTSFAYRSLADSLIAIRLPVGLIRGWRAGSTSNHGLLITALRGDAAPVILIDSRESTHPPQLRLSYTTPPGGRF